jgi:hypothetical protein
MKNFFLPIIVLILMTISMVDMTYAVDNKPGEDTMSQAAANAARGWSNSSSSSSSYNGTDGENILGIDNQSLRAGNVDMSTIPTIIVNVINVLLGIAGTVAIFSLIYHAVQMQINSGITGDSSWVDKAKKWMIGALIGFVIAILAWFLVTRAVDLLSGAS